MNHVYDAIPYFVINSDLYNEIMKQYPVKYIPEKLHVYFSDECVVCGQLVNWDINPSRTISICEWCGIRESN